MKREKRDGDGAEEFEVGYCKPPQANRFKPGKSGNPRGRPRGSRSRGSKGANYEEMKWMALQEAARSIQIRDGDHWCRRRYIRRQCAACACNRRQAR